MMPLHIQIQSTVTTAVRPTPRVCQIAAMFGLGVNEDRRVQLIPPVAIPIRAGQLIFVTGASGGGKTTSLRLLAEQLRQQVGVHVVDFEKLVINGDCSLVDALDGSLEQVVRWLSLCGLNDAFVMLRKPCELSDGQRYRFRLAMAMAQVETSVNELTVVLADEFTSTLDRQTAMVIARSIRKWVDRLSRRGHGVCFVAATTHDDLLESLSPDTLVVAEPGEGLTVLEKPAG